MAKEKNQHVVPREGQWAVVGEGNSRATVVVPTQERAIEKVLCGKGHFTTVG